MFGNYILFQKWFCQTKHTCLNCQFQRFWLGFASPVYVREENLNTESDLFTLQAEVSKSCVWSEISEGFKSFESLAGICKTTWFFYGLFQCWHAPRGRTGPGTPTHPARHADSEAWLRLTGLWLTQTNSWWCLLTNLLTLASSLFLSKVNRDFLSNLLKCCYSLCLHYLFPTQFLKEA